jgi:hypothetical protein
MLTERVADWVDAHVTESPFSEETQAVIEQYAPPRPAARRARYQELALVVAHALIMIPFILGVALAGALTSALGIDGAKGAIYRVAVAGLTWCCVGLALHLWRFYDALIAVYRSRHNLARADTDWHWPRASSDRDFIAQAVIALTAAVLV